MNLQGIIISLFLEVLKRFFGANPKVRLVLKNPEGRPELLFRPQIAPFTATQINFYIENKSKNASASYVNLEIKLPQELGVQNEIFAPHGDSDGVHWKRITYSELGQGLVWRFEGKGDYRIGPKNECPIGRTTFYLYPGKKYQDNYKIEYKISTENTRPLKDEVLLRIAKKNF